jgi:hypothetical protein
LIEHADRTNRFYSTYADILERHHHSKVFTNDASFGLAPYHPLIEIGSGVVTVNTLPPHLIAKMFYLILT